MSCRKVRKCNSFSGKLGPLRTKNPEIASTMYLTFILLYYSTTTASSATKQLHSVSLLDLFSSSCLKALQTQKYEMVLHDLKTDSKWMSLFKWLRVSVFSNFYLTWPLSWSKFLLLFVYVPVWNIIFDQHYIVHTMQSNKESKCSQTLLPMKPKIHW